MSDTEYISKDAFIAQEDKDMLIDLWKTISNPKYYELRDQAWQLMDFLQRVEKAECGFPAAPVPAPSGLDWIDPTKSTPKYSYSTTTTPNEEWQKNL